MLRRWIGASSLAVLLSVTMLATETVAYADTVSDGSCSASSTGGGRMDGLGSLVASINSLPAAASRAGDAVRHIDWGRVGRDALGFTEGLVIGAAMAVAAVAAVSFLVATFPAWGTAIVVGATVIGVGMLAYGVYDTVKNWNSYGEQQKFFVAGNWIGGIVGGMGPGAALGRSIGEGGSAALGRAFPAITRVAPLTAPRVPVDVTINDRWSPFRNRVADNAKLLEDPARVNADLERAGVSRERFDAMRSGERPLVFNDNAQYSQFLTERAQMLDELGVKGTDKLKGTSTTFYTENPSKPLGKFYDQPGFPKSDVDIELTSPDITAQMTDAGIGPNPKYPWQFKNGEANGIYERYPEIKAFDQRWSKILGRDVETKVMVDANSAPPGGWPLPRPQVNPSSIVAPVPGGLVTPPGGH